MQINIVVLLSLTALAVAAPNPAPQRVSPPLCSNAGECRGWCEGRIPYCEMYPDM